MQGFFQKSNEKHSDKKVSTFEFQWYYGYHGNLMRNVEVPGIKFKVHSASYVRTAL